MKFTLESSSAVTIRSVSDGEIRIGNEVHSGPVALTSEGIMDAWLAPPLESLSIDDLDELLAGEPELLVLGTGATQVLPGRQLMFAMARRGVGLEMMDTAAAARTFNVLVGDGRSVAAVLYL